MPLRKYMMNGGCGQCGGRETILEKQSDKSILNNNVGLANIKLLRKMLGAKPTAQAPGQLVNYNTRPLIGYGKKKQRGGRQLGVTRTDKYGAYMYYPNLVND